MTKKLELTEEELEERREKLRGWIAIVSRSRERMRWEDLVDEAMLEVEFRLFMVRIFREIDE